MTIVLILGLVLLATAIALLVRGALPTGARTTGAVDQIGAYGFQASHHDLDADMQRRPFHESVADWIGGLFGRWVDPVREDALKTRLMRAGMYTTSPAKYIGYTFLLSLGLLLVWIWVGGVLGFAIPVVVIGAIAAPLLGVYASNFYVSRRISERRRQIDRELPELLDLLVVSVEAGIAFTGALRLASTRIRGPLGQELRLTLQEQNMGLSTSEALDNMLERCDTPGMRSFVRSINQGEQLGVSMGQILRNIAEEMRKRRKAAAEEQAQKAPIKMLFPLGFFIFPAIFVVVLAPALIEIWRVLGG